MGEGLHGRGDECHRHGRLGLEAALHSRDRGGASGIDVLTRGRLSDRGGVVGLAGDADVLEGVLRDLDLRAHVA